MEIFQKHTTLIEDHIVRGLRAAIPDFSMESFLEMSDFEMFKESMLAYKEQCVEKTSQLSPGFCLSVAPTVLHTDDMEDGEERLDLMDGLNIAPLSPGAKSCLNDGDGPPAFGIIPMGSNSSA